MKKEQQREGGGSELSKSIKKAYVGKSVEAAQKALA